MKKVFGTRNERLVKRYLRTVDQVSVLEPDIRKLTDPELREKTVEFRRRFKEDGVSAQSILHEVFAIAREAMDRAVGIRNIFNPEHGFDPTQLPESAQKLYAETAAKIAEIPDAEPTGDLLGCSTPIPAWLFVDIPVDLYQAVRELHPKSKPPFRARPFDVQIIGAIVLYEGHIAEMKTGEGKTIVAPLATYLSVLQGNQVHVVTVNDYLVQRDRDWTFPFFRALGLTIGAIHPVHANSMEEMQRLSQQKMNSYQCDVVYGTTSEFGFDYLRDNMKLSTAEQLQKHRNFAIVDEVDSTLIDEARTPLIISGLAHDHKPRYDQADSLARHLLEKQKEWNRADQKVQSGLVAISSLEGDIRNARDKESIPALKEKLETAKANLSPLEEARDQFTQYYEVEMDKKRATLTHSGIAEAQIKAGVGSFYVGENIDLPHLMEQAIRAHTVYQKDRDYVIAPDEENKPSIVIVDQNTGRKMAGRQWSDGLHQAVESKEGVPIKEETQTMATITIQNFFKLYDKISGMTGTADTEATEFYEIYKLDVIVIPTNVPVIRDDRNDLVFIAEKDKWDAVVDEIKHYHDVGRPVLVGTTSVERSDMLSTMLTRKHNVKHEVLNAKQHEREADIVLGAGQLGAVMIATNMAGRGTDIKLARFTREELIDHWKRRSICPKEVNANMSDDEVFAAAWRHLAPKELGLKKSEIEALSDEEVRLALLRHWAAEHTWLAENKISSMTADQLVSELDASGGFLLHKLRFFENIEDLGGLHVIGTERHEARRIDNQLRGRCGRQGDNGSSRFFLSLEDDLMKMFAGDTTLKVLSKLGMKEGDAIEHPMLTKAVSRAQRKVEERNFLGRKNLLEWDELLNIQRGEFYAMRQDVLEGHNVKELIFNHIDDAVVDAVSSYLEPKYVASCIAEWVRENLSVTIDPARFRKKDRTDLHRLVRTDATEEAGRMIELTIGEYMPTDIDLGKGTIERADRAQWNLPGLVDWANTNFKAGLTIPDIRDLEPDEVVPLLEIAAAKMIEEIELDPLDKYLVPHYGANELAKWAKNKFEAEIDVEALAALESLPEAEDLLMKEARAAYARREIEYPIEFALDATAASMPQNPEQAVNQLCAWVKFRYELDWKPHALPSPNPRELRDIIIDHAKKWTPERIAERAERAATAAGNDPEKLNEWFEQNCGVRLTDEERERASEDPKSTAEEKITALLRAELAQFERWVLLQIVDQAWKDHLHAIDMLRESIGFRSFSQRDPRIEFKREGASLFDEMHMSIRDKVTDLIFKARLTPQIAPPPAGTDESGRPSLGDGESPRRRPAPQAAQPAVAAAAATQRRSKSGGAEGRGNKLKPIRAAVTVGRNEPCPCNSGKKFKQCCGKK